MSDPEKRGEEQPLSPDELKQVECFFNPDGTMSREYALCFVQDTVVEFLKAEVEQYRKHAALPETEATSAADMRLCAEMAEQVCEGLRAANTALLAARRASQQRVVTPGAAVLPFRLPGGKPPSGSLQ